MLLGQKDIQANYLFKKRWTIMKLVIHNEISNLTAKRVAAAALEGIDILEGYRVNHHNGDLIIEPDDLQTINLSGEINDYYRELEY